MLLIALALIASFAEPTQQKTKDAKPNFEAVFAAPRFGTTFDELDARIRELEAIQLTSIKDVQIATTKLLDVAKKGRKLEKKSGSNWWFEKEKRGLFIVGGETGNPKGLLLALHGGGQGSGDATSAQGVYAGAASKLDWLMICPEVLEKTEHGWTDSGTEEFVVQLVEAALRTWKIDRDNVYVSGHSMGGYGTWTMGAHHADRVAALAASAGAPTPYMGTDGKPVDIAPGVVPNLRNVPIVIYQSDDDPNVPPETNRIGALKLDEAQKRWGGFVHEYWEVPSRQHDLPPGGMSALLAKIEKRVRDTRPTKVVWQPALAWKRQFYWLWWDRPVIGALVVADADKTKNEVVVTCDKDAKGLEVLLDEKLVDLAKEVVVKLNDKEVFRGVPSAEMGTLAKTSLSGDAQLMFAVRVKLAP